MAGCQLSVAAGLVHSLIVTMLSNKKNASYFMYACSDTLSTFENLTKPKHGTTN